MEKCERRILSEDDNNYFVISSSSKFVLFKTSLSRRYLPTTELGKVLGKVGKRLFGKNQ